jgi:hypothetical protein
MTIMKTTFLIVFSLYCPLGWRSWGVHHPPAEVSTSWSHIYLTRCLTTKSSLCSRDSLVFRQRKVALCVAKYSAMKEYGGIEHIDSLVGERWAARPGRFTPDNHWIGDWVDPRAGLDIVEKRKFLTLPGLEVSRYTDYRLLFFCIQIHKLNMSHVKVLETSRTWNWRTFLCW